MQMTDWADGIETRNYGIKCKIETGILMELMRMIVGFALVAGAFLHYSWVRIHIINTGYELQNLSAQEESLLRAHKALILEEETLRNPQRIDLIARGELRMAPLRPNQLIQSRLWDAGGSISNEMAMVDSKAKDLKKSSLPTRAPGIYTIR